MIKQIEWIGPPQYTDFGRVDTGDVINVGLYGNLEPVAAAWVEQGYAKWVDEKEAKKPAKGKA